MPPTCIFLHFFYPAQGRRMMSLLSSELLRTNPNLPGPLESMLFPRHDKEWPTTFPVSLSLKRKVAYWSWYLIPRPTAPFTGDNPMTHPLRGGWSIIRRTTFYPVSNHPIHYRDPWPRNGNRFLLLVRESTISFPPLLRQHCCRLYFSIFPKSLTSLPGILSSSMTTWSKSLTDGVLSSQLYFDFRSGLSYVERWGSRGWWKGRQGDVKT